MSGEKAAGKPGEDITPSWDRREGSSTVGSVGSIAY